MKRAKQLAVLVVVVAVAVSGTILIAPRRSTTDDPRMHRVFEFCFGLKELLRRDVRALRQPNPEHQNEAYKIWFSGQRLLTNSPLDIELCSGKSTNEILGGRDPQADCRVKPGDFACFAEVLEAWQHAIESEWPEFP